MGSATREPYGGRVSADQPHRWRPMTSAPTDQHRWERAAALGFGETEPVDPWSIDQEQFTSVLLNWFDIEAAANFG